MQEVDSCRPREQQRPILLSPSSQHHHRHHNPCTTTCIPIVAVLPPLFPSPWNYHQYIHSWDFSWTSSTTVSAPLILHTLSQCHHRRCNHCTTSNISIPVRMKPPSNFQCLCLHPLPPRVCSGWNSSRNRSFSLFFHFFILICFSFFLGFHCENTHSNQMGSLVSALLFGPGESTPVSGFMIYVDFIGKVIYPFPLQSLLSILPHYRSPTHIYGEAHPRSYLITHALQWKYS